VCFHLQFAAAVEQGPVLHERRVTVYPHDSAASPFAHTAALLGVAGPETPTFTGCVTVYPQQAGLTMSSWRTQAPERAVTVYPHKGQPSPFTHTKIRGITGAARNRPDWLRHRLPTLSQMIRL